MKVPNLFPCFLIIQNNCTLKCDFRLTIKVLKKNYLIFSNFTLKFILNSNYLGMHMIYENTYTGIHDSFGFVPEQYCYLVTLYSYKYEYNFHFLLRHILQPNKYKK